METRRSFTYDGEDVSLKKAWIYGKMTAAQYEASYSSYFGENFWTMDMGTDDEGNAMTFEDYAKEQIISRIKQIIVLNNHAEEAGASLTEEEEEQCAQYAAAFAEDTTGAEILAECGATEDDMTEIYEENALAAKVQEYMIKDTDTNVSDDEARETTITRVVFATTNTDDQGQTVDMSEEEKAQVLATAQAALAKVQAGTDIADVAEEQGYTNTAETFAAGESEEGEAFEKLLAGMKDGDITRKYRNVTTAMSSPDWTPTPTPTPQKTTASPSSQNASRPNLPKFTTAGPQTSKPGGTTTKTSTRNSGQNWFSTKTPPQKQPPQPEWQTPPRQRIRLQRQRQPQPEQQIPPRQRIRLQRQRQPQPERQIPPRQRIRLQRQRQPQPEQQILPRRPQKPRQQPVQRIQRHLQKRQRPHRRPRQHSKG